MQQLQDALIDNSDEVQLANILYVLEKKRKFDTLNTLKDLIENNEIQLALKALELLESNNDLDISNILEFRNEMNQAFGDSWEFSNGIIDTNQPRYTNIQEFINNNYGFKKNIPFNSEPNRISKYEFTPFKSFLQFSGFKFTLGSNNVNGNLVIDQQFSSINKFGPFSSTFDFEPETPNYMFLGPYVSEYLNPITQISLMEFRVYGTLRLAQIGIGHFSVDVPFDMIFNLHVDNNGVIKHINYDKSLQI